jgi:glucosamine--fructose-6-phosphate aminotransferase (isomerizing)
MSDSLTVQIAMAPDFIADAWPQVEANARSVLVDWLKEIEDIIICGCGDSHHASLNLELALTMWAARRVRAASAMTAARYLIPNLNRSRSRTLVIGISASGEVARTIEAIELANAFGARTLGLTGAGMSSLVEIAQKSIVLPIPDIPHGPGLLSYLASLLMGFSISVVAAQNDQNNGLHKAILDVPEVLANWSDEQKELGRLFAEGDPQQALVFLGSGPAYGSALFGAAKMIEAAGVNAWGQDIEEWSHLEYFCEPADMPTWILRAGGRSTSREEEILVAAHALGRRIAVSTWMGRAGWTPPIREALSPLGLWIGPTVLAARLAGTLGEKPFRGFTGGRSQAEGGGMSRIRSSQRMSPDQVDSFRLK